MGRTCYPAVRQQLTRPWRWGINTQRRMASYVDFFGSLVPSADRPSSRCEDKMCRHLGVPKGAEHSKPPEVGRWFGRVKVDVAVGKQTLLKLEVAAKSLQNEACARSYTFVSWHAAPDSHQVPSSVGNKPFTCERSAR